MIRAAIVEDDADAAALMESYLHRYGEEINETFVVEKFANAIIFIEDYKDKYDIVFMDIEMPHMNGMEAAKLLRQRDNVVTLIFVTNMAQFAIKGYEVDALDFIVKPVNYYDFTFRMQKVIARLKQREEKCISVREIYGKYIRIVVSHIKYIEVISHKIIYHCEEGDFEATGTLKNIESQLPETAFARCNSCYLVNLAYVNSVDGFTVDVAGEMLKISQPKKKDFMRALNDYIGGNF